MNDRVSLSDSQKMTCSLYFLHLERLKLRVLIPGAAFYNSKRRLQACFRYNGINHALWVTDPQLEQKYLAGEKSEFEIGECFVTVSLGEPLEGYCYKLVATVITPERQ